MASKQLLQLPNLLIERDGAKVVMTFDPKQTQGQSSTGKSDIIVTTKGNIRVEDFVVGINIYRPR